MLLAALLLGLSTPAPQFDLMCRGTEVTVGSTVAEDALPKPWKERIAIDLRAGMGKHDYSSTNFPVVVTPVLLTLKDGPSGDGRERITVNRTTGSYSRIATSESGLRVETSGLCEKRKFSGLSGQ